METYPNVTFKEEEAKPFSGDPFQQGSAAMLREVRKELEGLRAIADNGCVVTFPFQRLDKWVRERAAAAEGLTAAGYVATAQSILYLIPLMDRQLSQGVKISVILNNADSWLAQCLYSANMYNFRN